MRLYLLLKVTKQCIVIIGGEVQYIIIVTFYSRNHLKQRTLKERSWDLRIHIDLLK